MESLKLSGNSLTVNLGGRKLPECPLGDLRLAYLVATVKERWFVVAGGSDLMVVDLDDEEQREGIEHLHGVFRDSKPRELSGIDICLADYGGNRTVVPLKNFKKAGIDIIDLLEKTRSERTKRRGKWLSTDPAVTLKGRFGKATLNRRGYSLSAKKNLLWDQVGQIQIDKQESLITTTHLLIIPQGVSGGMFSMKKYKYALKSIPNKLARIYLAECFFWRNEALEKRENDLEEEALQELVRDGVVSGDGR